MTQEEKFEEAKRLYETANADQRYVLESLFPELAESEDERIRKAILELVKQSSEILEKKNQEQMIAWLEKQAEQKHTPKHKIGDTIYYNSFGEVKSMVVSDVAIDGTDNPMYEDKDGNAVFEKDLIEQKPIDKAEHKFKVGDEIKTSNEESLTITKIDEKGYWSEDLFICDFGDAAKWELVEQKAWTEEDKNMLKWVIGYLENKMLNTPISEERTACKNAIAWLKDLKDRVQPQSQWKPSEQDILLLERIFDGKLDSRDFQASLQGVIL